MDILSYGGFCLPKNFMKENQDSVLPISKIKNSYFLAIADGVGAYAGAKKASEEAINFIRDEGNYDLFENGKLAFEKLRNKIIDKCCDDASLKYAATTLTLLIVTDEEIKLFHIGDCRAYIRRNNKLIQITTDHTQHQKLLDEGIYTKKELNEMAGKNVLYTAISKNIEMIIQEETFYIEEIMDKNETFDLYIMSDGAHHFWEKRPRFSQSTIENPSQFASSLFRRIARSGPTDDYSLVTAKFKVSRKA